MKLGCQIRLRALASSHGSIHVTASSVPATPPWMGEVTLSVAYLCKQGTLNKKSRARALCAVTVWPL